MFVQYGCGEASRPPIIDRSGGAGGNGEPGSGASEAGSDGAAGTGAIAGSGGASGAAPLSGSGGYSGAGAGGTLVVDSGAGGAQTCFDVGTDPARNRVQPGNVCDRLTTIQCAAEGCCCDNPGRDLSTCKRVMMQYCREQLRIDSISADRTTGFDPVFAEQVFEQYERQASECRPSVVSWGVSFEGLRGIIKGTIEPGQPCTPSGDWGETLDEAGAAALASCRDPENTACSHPAMLLWLCSPRVDVGGACITDLNCLEGLYCDNPSLLLLGAVCRQRKAVGEPCALANECQTLICRYERCAEVTKENVYCLAE